MKYLNRILKNRELHDSSIVLFSNIFAQAVNFIVVLIITKVLSVDEYGKYAIINTILSLAIDLSDMGMNSSVTKFVAEYHNKDQTFERTVITYATRKKLRNSALVIALMMLSSKFIASFFVHDDSYTIYVIIVSFCIGFTLISSMNKAIFQGRQIYKLYFYSVVIDTISYFALVGIFYITNNLTVFSVIVSNVIRMLISMWSSSLMAGLNIREILSVTVENSEVINKFSSFSKWMLLWAVFANLQSRADVILLSQLTTISQVSYYDVANKLTKPILLVLSAYATVMNPIYAQLGSSKELKNKVKQTAKFIAAVSGLLIIACLLSEPVLVILFGNKYNSSIIPLRIMLISLIFFVWTVPYNSALYALNKPSIFALAAGIGLLINIAGDYLLLPKFGAVGAAMTYFIAQVESFLVAYIAYKKIVKI